MTAVADLVAIYRDATPAQIARGRDWYPGARRKCSAIARDTATPLRRVVGVLAVTSPDCQLATNLGWARKACDSPGASVGRYPARMSRVSAEIVRGERRPSDVGGPKVAAFYRAIIGDTDAVVLDRWALRAAGHTRDTATPRQYDRIAADFREAAAIVGETPRDFQAVIWIVLRDRLTRSDGTAVRLADIHELAA